MAAPAGAAAGAAGAEAGAEDDGALAGSEHKTIRPIDWLAGHTIV